ncbi:MAG: calcium-binding protein [Myxococcales bacterium]|nr:calcium-binding protein [Myxococcales bacterium]
MTTRRLALALLLPLTFTVACDQGLPDKDVADSMDEAMMKEEALPPSHAGEACEDQWGETQPCSADGEVGVELCASDPMTYQNAWSACFVDTCETQGATQACDADGEEGTQICIKAGEALVWGLCVVGAECTPGETRDCGLGDEFMINQGCHLSDEGVPYWGWEDCNTPLVLSFDGRAPTFAAPTAAAAAFDITGAGACTSTEWPSAATPWLALDRDHNGSIDGGHELFGNGTRMAAGGRAEHGFDALGELDSDGDGRITASDARWGELVLWADHDGDRRSSGWELLPLESYGVEAIELGYHRAVECDGRGNCGIERASFTFREGGAARSGEVVDVYLACAE